MKQAIDRPIALVGMMGSGKSLVGRRLANQLDLPFVDSDTEVETAAGISIAEIFELAGEPKFRSMERDAIQGCRRCRTFDPVDRWRVDLRAGNSRSSARAHHVVWLDASPETLLSRIGSVGSRPLLHTDDPLQTLRELAETRQADYGRAHITVKTDRLSAAAAVNAVLDALDSHLAET